MKVRNKLIYGVLPIAIAALVGCGTGLTQKNTTVTPANNTKTVTGKTVVIGADAYKGTANLQKFEGNAAKHPTDASAQVQAGVSARVNGNDALAIQYYQKAIKANPNAGIAYNNIGNIYFRDNKDAKSALPYYQKATQVQPSYIYGWWNLALVQQNLGQESAAEQTVAQGLKAVPKTDPNYKYLSEVLQPQKK